MMKKSLLILLFLILVLPASLYLALNQQIIEKKALETTTNQPPKREYIKGEILVMFKDSVSSFESNFESNEEGLPASLKKLGKKYRIKKIKKIIEKEAESATPLIYKITFWEKGVTENALKELSQSEEVAFAEPNYIFRTQIIPNDPYYSSSGSWGQPYPDLWGLKKIQSEGAWDIATGSATVVVAVIDTGVDRNHPDLVGNVWTNPRETPNNDLDDDHNGYVDDYHGWDFANNDKNPMDDNGHGTHVAGTIAAVGNNGLGVVGINWVTKIMSLKFLDSSGAGSLENAILAVRYAANQGAKISSNSWGCFYCESELLHQAFQYAYQRGMISVAAAGNSATDALDFSPAAYDEIITVGATDHNDQRAWFSNTGEKIDVVAPGTEILSLLASQNQVCSSQLIVGTHYCRLSGTSMATPHVSGLAALLWAKDQGLTNEEIRQLIKTGVHDLGPPGKDKDFGLGRINAAAALQFSVKPLVPLITNLKSGQTISGSAWGVYGSILGTNFARYKLEVGAYDFQENGRSEPVWTEIASSDAQVSNGILGIIDTFSIPAKYLYVRLTAYDRSGRTYQAQVNDIRLENYSLYLTSPRGLLTENRVIDIIGTVEVVDPFYFQNYTLDWQEEGSPSWSTAGITLENGGLRQVGRMGVLGTWDLSFLRNNKKYTLRLTLNLTGGGSVNKTAIVVYGLPPAERPGWPQAALGDLALNPDDTFVLAEDLDGNGRKEVIVSTANFDYDGRIYVWDDQGTLLPGWPHSFPYPSAIMIPSIGDVNGDGKKEIVVATNKGKLYVFDKNAQLLPGWPKGPTAEYYYNHHRPPVLVDIDKDGRQEIFLFSGGGLIHLYSGRGQEMPGWPFNLNLETNNEIEYLYLSAGDVDGDRYQDLIVGTLEQRKGTWENEGSKIYVLNADGSLKPGWPKILPRPEMLYADNAPVIGDVNHDGKAEIVAPVFGEDRQYLYIWNGRGETLLKLDPGLDNYFSSLSLGNLDADPFLEILTWNRGKLLALNHDGSFLPNFPVNVRDGDCLVPSGSLTLGDINNDNKKEILYSGYLVEGCSPLYPAVLLYSYTSDGRPQAGFPKYVLAHSSPLISDLENDGRLELLFLYGEKVHVWNLDKPYQIGNLDWPEYLHDSRHTSSYRRQSVSTPTPTPTPYDLRVNVGGPKYTDPNNRIWKADRPYSSGDWGYLGGQTSATTHEITDTANQTIYQTERYALDGYKFDLPNGNYRVTLKFAEIYQYCQYTGCRVFDVKVEGQTKLSNFDIFRLAGGAYKALDRSFEVTVSDGQLNLDFIRKVQHPKVNAIRITKI